MTLTVGLVEWQIKPILTCNLKALMKMMGLYDVFHPTAKWKCPFCPVSTEELHKFEKDCWPFHSEEDWCKWAKEVAQRSGEGKHTYGRKAHSCVWHIRFLIWTC